MNYTYDSLGNIETISEGGIQRQKYYCDDLNQLVREDNLDLNKTIVYSYDLGGNITSKTEYAYQTGSTISGTPVQTDTYSYTDSNWKDKLTSYNGNNITYDAIGNPTAYYNGFSFTWEKGRQLASATNGTDTVTYVYDHDGRRVGKTVNGVTSSYTLEGDKVLFERHGDTNLWYYYDASGAPVAIKVDNVIHLYRKNLQGDITGIYSGLSGELLVSYVYDAWGKPVITDEANTTESAELIELNPYLYRGYRYDQETGLYYLQSRYYDPETGRFVNADAMVSTNQGIHSTNMFAYCENNPIIRKDDGGKCWWIAIGAVVGGIIGGVSSIIEQTVAGEEINWGVVGIATAAGVLSGALASTGIGSGASVALNAAISGAEYIAVQTVKGEEVDTEGLVVSVGIGAVTGFIGGKGANGKHLKGVIDTSKRVLKTAVSPKKIAMYSGKLLDCVRTAIKGAERYLLAEVAGIGLSKIYEKRKRTEIE